MTPSVSLLILFAVVIGMASVFALTNGILDGAGLVSTVIMTRVMDAPAALMLVAACEVIGVFLLGQAVSKTMAYHVVIFPASASAFEILSILAATLMGALLWNVSMWRLALPSSSSHALIGGLLGSSLAAHGVSGVHWHMVTKIFLLLAMVPLIGAFVAYGLSLFSAWVGQFLTPAAGGLFRTLQMMALAGLAMVHGSNDGQKSMAMMWLAVAALQGSATSFPAASRLVPAVIAGSLAFGILIGSRRIIRTVGRRLYPVQTLQSFCAQMSAISLVGVSSWLGYPMSTTQVVSTTVLGAGAATHLRGVRWDLAQDIVVAWVVTIPAAALLSASMVWLINEVHHVVS